MMAYNSAMINIVLNGKPASMPVGINVLGLLERMQLTGKRIAVEVNGEIAPRSLHGTRTLDSGDRVEIVQAIGGG